MDEIKVVYVGGKFTGKNSWEIHRNVFRAESLGMAVAEAGAMPLIPHKNTSNFFGTITEEFWYRGTLKLLTLCDAMILVSGWEDSKGTKAEVAWARDNGMPVLESIEELKAWLVTGIRQPCTRPGCSHGYDSCCRGGPEL